MVKLTDAPLALDFFRVVRSRCCTSVCTSVALARACCTPFVCVALARARCTHTSTLYVFLSCQAGGTAFGLLLVSALVLLGAAYFVRLRRQDELDEIHVRLGFLRSWLVPTTMYGLVVIFTIATWAEYYGDVKRNVDTAILQQAGLALGNIQYARFGAGPALAVVSTVLATGAAVLVAVFRDEQDRGVAASRGMSVHTGAYVCPI